MKHIIETYGDGTLELIRILYRTANSALSSFDDFIEGLYFSNGINRIIFTSIDELGVFDSKTNNILLSNILLESDVSMEFLQSVVLHECAHFICITAFNDRSHGSAFKSIASKIGAPEEFTHPQVSLSSARDTSSQYSKIKKLLALSESSNPNESHSALLKARSLMAELNINNIVDKEFIYASTLFEAKRYSAKEKVLTALVQDISGIFSVKESTFIQSRTFRQKIFGTKSQVEIALYIYDYLAYTLDKEYTEFKATSQVQGRTLESFYYGIYDEMYKKFNKSDSTTKEQSKALAIVQKDIRDETMKYYFENNSLTRSNDKFIVSNKEAFESGQRVGKRTTIHSAINKDKSKKKLYIK